MFINAKTQNQLCLKYVWAFVLFCENVGKICVLFIVTSISTAELFFLGCEVSRSHLSSERGEASTWPCLAFLHSFVLYLIARHRIHFSSVSFWMYVRVCELWEWHVVWPLYNQQQPFIFFARRIVLSIIKPVICVFAAHWHKHSHMQ